MVTPAITFNPRHVVNRLLSFFPDGSRDVMILIYRYGLGAGTRRMTLEVIGKEYGITRERVRQVENYTLDMVRKSAAYRLEKAAFAELENLLRTLGGIAVEDDFLACVSKDKNQYNHTNFLLVIGEAFTRRKEDAEFEPRWLVNEELSDKVETALRKLCATFTAQDLLSESEVLKRFLPHLGGVAEGCKTAEQMKRWLKLSKAIGVNELGDWGPSHSANIKARGLRDYAFLLMRKHGSPMHFRDVAKQIAVTFRREANVTTTHNGLIEDPRFVLVGRGLYALAEWGYAPGIVRDVIRRLIEKNGPMTKGEVMRKVKKERYVREHTIAINLQNRKYFQKDKDGKYSVLIRAAPERSESPRSRSGRRA